MIYMKKMLLFYIIIATYQNMFGQNLSIDKYKFINQSYNDSNNKNNYTKFGIDKQTKDTIKYLPLIQKFQIVTLEGIIITDGQLTSHGGEQEANGFWIERYRNGNLKEHGNYYTNDKIGTWVYFHDNGNIKKVETLKRPYSTELSEYPRSYTFKYEETILSNPPLKSGYYKEFYENGNLKLEGQFVIMEKFQTRDTIITFNPESYENILNITEGEFWKPKALKTGVWNNFDENGKLVFSKRYYQTKEDKYLRLIKARYEELLKTKKK